MATFAGQNIGANRLDRVVEGTKAGMWMGVGVSVLLTLMILLFGEWLMRMFTSTEQVVDLGVRMMRILAVGYIAMGVTQILSGVMRGAGDTMTPMWISIITTVIIRVPIAYAIAYFTRSEAQPTARRKACSSRCLSWYSAAVTTVALFKIGKWRDKSLVSNTSASVE